MRRDIDRKGHARPGLAAGVPVDALRAIVRPVEGNGFDRHDLTAPAPHSDGVAAAVGPGSAGGCSPTEPGMAVRPLWGSILPPARRCDPSVPATSNHKAPVPGPLGAVLFPAAPTARPP